MTRRLLITIFASFLSLPAGAQRAAAPAAGGTAPVSLTKPTRAALSRQGPDSFDVAFYTSKGRVTARIRRPWAPLGSDRLFHAVGAKYYDGVRFYRVVPGFMAQFGYHGQPPVTAAWDGLPLKDEPVKVSNTRGTLTFANKGPNTRTVQLFFNYANNQQLDGMGFAPIGGVQEGMSVVDALYAGYGEGAPRGAGPDQGQMAVQGNAYLAKSFPKLDQIDSARVTKRWP
jgi:peptidyl-prolyl cis-trans isomerase A (cyclophilin A)